jgi:hypothetical protein
MITTINKQWLIKHGVSSNNKEMSVLVKIVNDEWEWRVGSYLAEQLGDKKVAEFETIQNNDEDERIAWLEKAYPDYKKVVDREANLLAREILKSKDKISLIKSWHN